MNTDRCLPVKCRLSYSPTSTYSDIAASNKVIFKDKYCTIKKPEYWDQWLFYHLKIKSSSEQLYYIDSDNDGLSNILEYYGNINFTNRDPTIVQKRKGRDVINFQDIGTSPKNPDTDGDYLLDGFEFINHLNPKKENDRNADDDNDLLSNLDEQIRHTNPLVADTDGDGVLDGTEVKNKR